MSSDITCKGPGHSRIIIVRLLLIISILIVYQFPVDPPVPPFSILIISTIFFVCPRGSFKIKMALVPVPSKME